MNALEYFFPALLEGIVRYASNVVKLKGRILFRPRARPADHRLNRGVRRIGSLVADSLPRSTMSLNRLLASTAGAALALVVAAAPALAAPAHPYEAIAGHYATMKQANAVAAQAKAKGFRTVVQVNGPRKIEVEYGNG